jgi:hypothetical protein
MKKKFILFLSSFVISLIIITPNSVNATVLLGDGLSYTAAAGAKSDCANGCIGLYGGYYEECDETYPPGTDGRNACFTEVRNLNRLCLGRCFMYT